MAQSVAQNSELSELTEINPFSLDLSFQTQAWTIPHCMILFSSITQEILCRGILRMRVAPVVLLCQRHQRGEGYVFQAEEQIKRKKSSWVFDYFKPLDKNNPDSKWVCNVNHRFNSCKACGHLYSRLTSTTTLAGHLQKAHNLSANSQAVNFAQMVLSKTGGVRFPGDLSDDESLLFFRPWFIGL